MSSPRQALYQRLPEIYRIRDAEQFPANQLRAFMDVLDSVPAGMRDNIEALYHDFFIDTCDDWIVPYLADLLGTSHLSGDPWTLRADVARTLYHRRRKGTLGAVESLAYTLSGWATQAVELRGNLAWTQHLNHQRPDLGGTPPLRERGSLSAAVRGGTLPIRDPAALSFLDGAFDPFAHVADLKPGQIGTPRYNLPNLGVFLWRLEDYTVPIANPGSVEAAELIDAEPDEAQAVVRCIVHPQGDPMVLFNTHRYRMGDDPPNLSHPDEVPGPMPWARLTSGAEHGNPAAYVRVDYYENGETPIEPGAGSPGLILHVPTSVQPPPPPDDPERAPSERWTLRGANLCAWEAGLTPKLGTYEIAIDPERGRVLFGLTDTESEANELAANLFISYTYGFSGPTGAHPVSRESIPHTPIRRGDSLDDALADAIASNTPQVLEIQDSATYTLDLAQVTEPDDDGLYSLLLSESLTLRAATGQRPVIRLLRPLRFGPVIDEEGQNEPQEMPSVTLEGLYITWDRAAESEPDPEQEEESPPFADPTTPLIARAALDKLCIVGCTLDPGGAWQLDGTEPGTRQQRRPSFSLTADYGFDEIPEAFDQIPRIELENSICGAVLAEGDAYELSVHNSIIDGFDAEETTDAPIAIGPPLFTEEDAEPPPDSESESGETTQSKGWGPTLEVEGLTCFGSARVTSLDGQGGIWSHSLQVQRHQQGCIRFSYFSGIDDRLPQHHGCVTGLEALIAFTDQRFGMPGYAQLRRRSDSRILEQGPSHDLMGAFGYLQNTHKWKNISIRFREYMPVGVRPLLIPVT